MTGAVKHESVEVTQTKATTLHGFAAFMCVSKVKFLWRIEETNEFTDEKDKLNRNKERTDVTQH